MNETDRRDEPFCWWGPSWSPPAPPSLADLIDGGAISPTAAALLAAAMGRRASVIVVARAAGAGKTTLLSALLPFLPDGTRRLYPRGQFEAWAFLDEPGLDPSSSAVLANEIGPHLPQYLWGGGVDRFLALRERGFCLGATAHAGGVEDLAAMLSGPPLRLPASRLAAFDLLAALEDDPLPGAAWRRVGGVWALGHGPRGSLRVREVAAGGAGLAQLAEDLAAPDQPNPLVAGISLPELERMAARAALRPTPEPPPDRPGAMLARRERALRSRPNPP